MRNAEIERLAGLVGEWTVTMSNAWFLEPADLEVVGKATIEWLGESFLVWRTKLGGDERSEMIWVIGRSDARDRFVMLYQDERGVCREFDLTFEDGRIEMHRADPDFHQRFVAEVEGDRIVARTDASEDEGVSWRKDFDLTFTRG